MSAWRLALRLLARDWRSGEIYLLSAALVLTVAAITAVGFFSERIEGTMLRQGGDLIAADLVIDMSSPPPQGFEQRAREMGLRTARILSFPSVVVGEQGPQLVQVKAVDGAYPLRGELRIRTAAAASEEDAGGTPGIGTAWVEPRLLHLLEAGIGDHVGLGEVRLRVAGLVTHEPDRGGNLFQLAPRVLISMDDIAATGLVSPASRVSYRLLLAGDAVAVDAFTAWIEDRLPVNARLIDGRTARPEFESAVDRAVRFLHLASLVTLLVAGAATALSSRRLVERQTDAVAVMRCLGAPRHLLTRVFVLRLVAFGVIASLTGVGVGFLAQSGLTVVLSEWFGANPPAPTLRPVFVGLGTGMTALLGFALPPLLQLARVPPLRVLRGDLGTPRLSAVVAIAIAGAAIGVLVFWLADDFQLAWRLLAGVAVALVCLALVTLLLIRVAALLATRSRGIWRLGLAGLTRRPTGTLLQVMGFGLGILALLLLAVVRVDLLRTWQESLPEGAPNRFLINIQPHEVQPISAWLARYELAGEGVFPMIRGRLTAINGRPVDPDGYENPRAQRLASREFNLSFAERLQDDNHVVSGRWWSAPGGAPELSVEEGLAETLGIVLGDELEFWVSGQGISARVTSLRQVQWDSFNVNFFVIASPSFLEGEAGTYVTSFFLPQDKDDLLVALTRRFPGVTLIDVDALLGQVRRVVERGVIAVEYVFLFTLLAGGLVMIAAIQASLEQRRSEHGILRTLGAGRRMLLASLAVEFTAAGLLAGLLATVFAELIGYLLADQLFGLAFRFNPWLWILGVGGSGLSIGLAGSLATYPLLIRPPLQTLRRGG